MNQYDLSAIIKSFVDTVNIKDKLVANLKENLDNNTYYITLFYKKQTELNPFPQDICFSISIPEDYPDEEPYVRCLTNFIEPTLFDNRNLLYTILQHYWSIKGVEEDKYEKLLQEIIDKIPKFLEKVKETFNSKTLIYYGGYLNEEIYEMNDFLSNEEIKMYKIKVYRGGKVKKDFNDNLYLIITDIYFLIFEPPVEMKNLGKLLIKGEIIGLGKRKLKPTNENEIIITVGYKDNNYEKTLNFYLINTTAESFGRFVDNKITKLRKKYDYFMDDEFKFGENLLDPKRSRNTFVQTEDLENTIKIIEYKEMQYNSRKTLNLIKELIVLYEKAIEILSAKNDPKYEEYLQKLKSLYNDKDQLEKI